MLTETTDSRKSRAWHRPAVLALIGLPAVAWVVSAPLPAWERMWALAIAIFAACKILTLAAAFARGSHPALSRVLGYSLIWPGMNAAEFLGPRDAASPPTRAWLFAVSKLGLGLLLIWAGLPAAMPINTLFAGWLGMVGLLFTLHFGLFDLLSLGWRTIGVRATPLMQNPLASASLADLWGRRWNVAFHGLVHQFAFTPFRQTFGPMGATLLVFWVSGLVHELVITLPAGGGYGLPTAYFLIQGAGLVVERSRYGHSWRLGHGLRGRLFTLSIAAGPAFWLFPPPFVRNIALPFFHALGAYERMPS